MKANRINVNEKDKSKNFKEFQWISISSEEKLYKNFSQKVK